MRKLKKAIAIALTSAALTTMSVSAFAAPAFADEITQEVSTDTNNTIDLASLPDHPTEDMDISIIGNLYLQGNEVSKYNLNYGEVVYIDRADGNPMDIEYVYGKDIIRVTKEWEKSNYFGWGTVTCVDCKSLITGREYQLNCANGNDTHFYELNKVSDVNDPAICQTVKLNTLDTTWNHAPIVGKVSAKIPDILMKGIK